MRIGYYGGTFDPPHVGHLAVARAARDLFRLDRVLLAPTGRQPLKQMGAHAAFRDRLEMVRLLCEGEAALEASAMDAPREDGTANYTVDVLRMLRAEGSSLFCIVGADSFLDLRRWKEPDELLLLAEWIVVSRPGFALKDLSGLRLSEEQRARVHLLTDVHVDVSATEIRAALARGGAGVKGVSPSVMRYIAHQHLYARENRDE